MRTSTDPAPPDVQREIDARGPWFHNLHLPSGQQTFPGHWLGDFPRFKWEQLAVHLPADLRGWTALDVGCNAGFYSFELARRGAEVTALDTDPRYLTQARWAARQFGLADRVRFREDQVYHLAREPEVYDLVLFMGVFYHLRYPFLGLELLARKTRRLMVFQTLTMADPAPPRTAPDVDLMEREPLSEPGWPKMAFVEHRLQDDPTNWWVPNEPACEAMLRACRLRVTARPGHEIWVCEPAGGPPAETAEQDEVQYRAALNL